LGVLTCRLVFIFAYRFLGQPTAMETAGNQIHRRQPVDSKL